MKRILAIIFALALSLSFLTSCGKGKDEKAGSKTDTTKKVEQKMTVEKAAKLENELATLLMQKYWPQFKGKEYKDVKDIYKQYLKEEDSVYTKYGVSVGKHGFNVQDYTYWVRDHLNDIKKFRKENPEYDFYNKYPEFSNANVKLFKLAMAEHAESK